MNRRLLVCYLHLPLLVRVSLWQAPRRQSSANPPSDMARRTTGNRVKISDCGRARCRRDATMDFREPPREIETAPSRSLSVGDAKWNYARSRRHRVLRSRMCNELSRIIRRKSRSWTLRRSQRARTVEFIRESMNLL